MRRSSAGLAGPGLLAAGYSTRDKGDKGELN